MTLRAAVFWLKDFLLLGKMKFAYSQIEKGIKTGKENIEQREALLEWAKREVPYYRQYKDCSFEQLPVVNKSIIKDGGDNFKADFWKGKTLHKETTSGSTGTPFEVVQDPGKRKRAQADSLYMSDFAGFHLGTRLYYIRVWNNLNKKSRLKTLLTNIVMQSSDNLSDDSLEAFLRQLENDHQEKSILAYASSLTALYQWMKRTGRKTTAKVACFITMSESFPDDAREGLKELFGCPVVSRYSDQECGLISQQCALGTEYHINTASFYVEILDLDKDVPVEDGRLGRIVVTDLYNRAMPLIRYDTGDLGVMSHECECGYHGKVLKRVEGRRVDFITATNGNLLSPVTIINAMWEYNDLLQWQFVQHAEGEFEMKLNCSTSPYAREAEMLKDIKGYVGDDARIKITYVDEIPLLASGKRKCVLNAIKK